MDREASAQSVDLIRKVIAGPAVGGCLPAQTLHREISRLETRLAGVHARGGDYRKVELSGDVRRLLARLEAGATLSGCVH